MKKFLIVLSFLFIHNLTAMDADSGSNLCSDTDSDNELYHSALDSNHITLEGTSPFSISINNQLNRNQKITQERYNVVVIRTLFNQVNKETLPNGKIPDLEPENDTKAANFLCNLLNQPAQKLKKLFQKKEKYKTENQELRVQLQQKDQELKDTQATLSQENKNSNNKITELQNNIVQQERNLNDDFENKKKEIQWNSFKGGFLGATLFFAILGGIFYCNSPSISQPCTA